MDKLQTIFSCKCSQKCLHENCLLILLILYSFRITKKFVMVVASVLCFAEYHDWLLIYSRVIQSY